MWIDESYVNKNHWNKYGYYIKGDNIINKPSGVGSRCCIIGAVNEEGWVGLDDRNSDEIFEDLAKTGKCGSFLYFKI